MFEPSDFGRDFITEIKRPLPAEACEQEFRSILHFSLRDAEGRGSHRIVPRSTVVLTFSSGVGETPTVTIKTRGATPTQLSEGIQAAAQQGAPIPHYYHIDGAEELEIFVCASEDQSAAELMHWAHAFVAACAKSDIHSEIVSAEYVRATETFTRPTPGAAPDPFGSYVRVVKAKHDTRRHP